LRKGSEALFILPGKLRRGKTSVSKLSSPTQDEEVGILRESPEFGLEDGSAERHDIGPEFIIFYT
jgi:hypothetical protein